MATTKRRFSTVAGVSVVSILFLALSYSRVKSPSSSAAFIHKDLAPTAVASFEGQAVVYQKMDSAELTQAVSLKGTISDTQNTIIKMQALQKEKLLKNNPTLYNKIPEALLERANRFQASITRNASGPVTGSPIPSQEDSLYADQATTPGSIEDSSAIPINKVKPGDIENRPYRYWLSGDATLPYNASLVSIQQQERHNLIHETCKKPNVRDVIFRPSDGRRSLISSYKNLLYCPILKAGSTNILRLLCWLYGPPCSTIKNLFPHNMVPHFLTRANKVAVNNSPEFLSFFSFALVRNPWKRLVSVYIQKFVETRQGLGFCDIKRRYPSLYSYYRRNRSARMSFKDYIEKCVIGQHRIGGILAQNGHWRPQYHMCSFCHLDYTFIGKIETMKSDERVILNAFGFQDIDATIADANRHLLPNEKANKTKLFYEDLWKDISPSTLKYLQKLYKIDFEMFNYPSRPLSD
ncbi:carbohydrate sulfotransferase 11-like [Watersipora subatra]|uniref:carbohydrate sulfotransferase 11-like n=1 Tax=Watersipora subatra TaxID=2589382 RepID=UPI00355C2BE9